MAAQLSSYESLGVIASALYGDVSKLRHRSSGSLAALKRMDLLCAARRRTKDTDRPIEEDVFAEVQTNLKLRSLGGHPHIVTMLDCFSDDHSVSLLTEFCGRGELLDVVNARSALLTVQEALRYFHQIAQAVAFLHTNGIAHRDLSLENVLVDDDDCCKLSDFGMATGSTRLRATGIGKVHYMAPEACRDVDQDDSYYNPFQADMWSLGVILITLLTGQYPFSHALDTDAHFRLLSQFGLVHLLERLDFDMDANDDVVDLLNVLLAVDPAERASAQQLLMHECFDDFSPVAPLQIKTELDDGDETESETEVYEMNSDFNEEEEEEDDDLINPAAREPKADLAAVAATCSFQCGVAGLFALRRPAAIDTLVSTPPCMIIKSSRKSPAQLKEQRHSVILLTPKLSHTQDRGSRTPPRRSPKSKKKSGLRGMFDGVFHRKKARGGLTKSLLPLVP